MHFLSTTAVGYLIVDILQAVTVVLCNHFTLSWRPKFYTFGIQPIFEISTKLCIGFDSLETTFEMTFDVHYCNLEEKQNTCKQVNNICVDPDIIHATLKSRKFY